METKNRETIPMDLNGHDLSNVRQLAAKDVLRLELRPIEVPENQTFVFSPANHDYASCFARVRLRSYEDLRILGFIPRKLAEEKIRQAIAADDAEAFDLAGKMLRDSGGDCGCMEKGARESTKQASPIRPKYNSIRKRHNPALARLVGDHYGVQMAWDEPLVAILRHSLLALAIGPEILTAVSGDIIIHRNATFAVSRASRLVMARNIWINKSGQFVSQSSYLRIWANSINCVLDFLDPNIVIEGRKTVPIWQWPDLLDFPVFGVRNA